MITDPAVRRVAVALIRSLNAAVIGEETNDDDLLARYAAAVPLAQAIVDVIREEVRAIG